MCVLLEYLNGVRYVNVWASIIQTFQLFEHTQVPLSSDKRGSTVYSYEHHMFSGVGDSFNFVKCIE